ncbi:MFS transporter [Niabella sp. 22666]|uniref:MFS transporter n=1 Tax=Niabella sp. 22666 TaxID=3453954 RepID=UPI003F847785
MKASFRKQQWQMLLATMFCYLFFYTGRHNFGWAAKNMAEDIQISFASVGWISFAMLIGYATGQLVNGNLADRFSSRKMILTGGLLSVATNIGISFCSSYSAILVLWCLNGYFQSLAWAPGTRIISNWWAKEERGSAFGFYTMAAGSSTVITFLLSILLVQNDSSWQYLFRLPVLFLLVAVIIFFVIARDKPSDKGFPDLYPDTAQASKTHWRQRYYAVFSNRKFMIASLAIGFESMARYGLIVWVPVHFLGTNWKDNPHYLWITLLMPLGMSVGAFTFGHISDRLLKGNGPVAIRLGMIVSAVLALLIFSTEGHHPVTGGLLMFASGFFVYGPQANFWPMSPQLLGEKYVATGVGVMNATAYIFAALGEPLLGFIIDRTGKTSFVFVAISIICLLCAAVVSVIRINNSQVALKS